MEQSGKTITSVDLLASPRAIEMVVEFINEVVRQIPEKPDHWSSCGQCERNTNTADDIIDEINKALTSTDEGACACCRQFWIGGKAMNDGFVQTLKVTDEWRSGGENFRLVDRGAGPRELQIEHDGRWVAESPQYIHGVLCARIESLANTDEGRRSTAQLGQPLDDALAAYWDAAYAEGREGRSHDTEDGAAQRALSSVYDAVRELVATGRYARAARATIHLRGEAPAEPRNDGDVCCAKD